MLYRSYTLVTGHFEFELNVFVIWLLIRRLLVVLLRHFWDTIILQLEKLIWYQLCDWLFCHRYNTAIAI